MNKRKFYKDLIRNQNNKVESMQRNACCYTVLNCRLTTEQQTKE